MMENEDIYLILEKINEVLQFQNIVLLAYWSLPS